MLHCCFVGFPFLPQLLTDCTDDLFTVTVRTTLWAGSGVEGVSLCRLPACTVRDVLVAVNYDVHITVL